MQSMKKFLKRNEPELKTSPPKQPPPVEDRHHDVKLFEVRDKQTFIPVLAIRLGGGNEQEQWLTRAAGFGKSYTEQSSYVLMVALDGASSGKMNSATYDWGDRTLRNAHGFIKENWDSLEGGDVIDVQFNLGETKTHKQSQR